MIHYVNGLYPASRLVSSANLRHPSFISWTSFLQNDSNSRESSKPFLSRLPWHAKFHILLSCLPSYVWCCNNLGLELYLHTLNSPTWKTCEETESGIFRKERESLNTRFLCLKCKTLVPVAIISVTFKFIL